jgi:hypothetical protein
MSGVKIDVCLYEYIAGHVRDELLESVFTARTFTNSFEKTNGDTYQCQPVTLRSPPNQPIGTDCRFHCQLGV